MKLTLPGLDKDLYMDGYLHSNLAKAKEIVKKDWDMIFLVDGGERAGKSVLAQQCGYFLDHTLNLARICFTPNEFKKAVLEAPPFTCVIYDEGYTGLNSRATMSVINRTLVSLLAEIGQKNLIIFVVMPTYFDLDKYVALWRSRALIHVYTGDDFERGYFAFYNVDTKKRLYIDGKKYYEYTKVKPNFIGRFLNGYTVDEAAYRQKKRDSMTGRAKEAEELQRRRDVEAELLERILSIGDAVPHKVKMQMLGMSAATYYRRLSEFREANKDFASDNGVPTQPVAEETPYDTQ
jgi:hypothetical protein